jgi:CubicO group peptidase (beta-lactamase class C family)
VVGIFDDDNPLFLDAYGNRMIIPQVLPMLKETLFDLASLTKSIATATSVIILKERGLIDLNHDISLYLPDFKRKISIFHLLTHTSGLLAGRLLCIEVKHRSDVVKYLSDLNLEYETGSKVVYSCLGYILLGEMIRKVTGLGLDEFADREIFKPLSMNDTFFNPPENRREECAATEDTSSFEKRMSNYRDYRWRKGVIVGEVHDENANFLGGVADLARFAKMLINGGENILSPDSIKMISTIQTPGLNESRGLGWIILPDKTLYHTGFTGTAIWINLDRRFFATLLTNRIHPDATKEGIVNFRQTFYRSVITK